MSGLLSLLTDTDNPRPMGISLSDHLAGMVACNGILAALNARHVGGRGQRVDTSLLEATVSFVGENAARYFEDGNVPSRATRTHLAQVFAFVDCEGKPFVVHLSSPAKFWNGLISAIERPEWRTDPRFSERKARARNYDALHAELAAIFCTAPRAHWLARLEERDVPSGPLYDLGEVFGDPQVEELGLRVRLSHPRKGDVNLIRNGVRMSKTPVTVRGVAPDLGQDNATLLGE